MKKIFLLLIAILFLTGCEEETPTIVEPIEILEMGEIIVDDYELINNSLTIYINKDMMKDSVITGYLFKTEGHMIEVTEIDESTIVFNGLWNNQTYRLEITYSLPQGEEQQVYVQEFKTERLSKPYVGFIAVDSGSDYINFSKSISDRDNVGELVEVGLYDSSGEKIDTVLNETEFSGLEAFVTYNLVMIYQYDLNDGLGVQFIEVETSITTSDPFSEYFLDITMGSEFGGTSLYLKKWEEPMKLYVDGVPHQDVLDELEAIISELNNIFTDGFYIEIVQTAEESNSIIFFGSKEEYVEKFNINHSYVDQNWGLFNYWSTGSKIDHAIIWIDTERPNVLEQRSLLREELTQSLGMANDSYEYENSVFYQGWTIHTSYTQMDENIIYAIYHPYIKAGMTKDKVLEQLVRIVEEGLLH